MTHQNEREIEPGMKPNQTQVSVLKFPLNRQELVHVSPKFTKQKITFLERERYFAIIFKNVKVVKRIEVCGSRELREDTSTV